MSGETLPVAYPQACALESALGDPANAGNRLSFQAAMQADEAEAFPDAAIDHLHRLGLQRAFVPARLGGEFRRSEDFIALGRVLARRDMNVAVSYSTLLWSVVAWIGGDARQQRRVADWILRHGHFPALAYSEPEHGADLLANQLRAVADDHGNYSLLGEKWPINRATRSQFLMLLARTDAGSHPRSQSMFIVDKSRLPAGRFQHLPRVPTHGLRGCDISGIRFDHCPLPKESLAGQPGHGLELALKGFQVTRSFCSALSLGVADSGLRITLAFARQRRLYGQRVLDLPHAADVLAGAYASLLMSECAAIVAARALHWHPGQFSTWSSVVKVQVSRACDDAMQQLAQVLGARHFMREGPAEGMFQKFMRDGAIVSVFDGSNTVCLDSLATFLPEIAKTSRSALPADDVRRLFDLRQPVPELDYGGLCLFGRGHDAVMQSLPVLRQQLAELPAQTPGPVAEINALADRLALAWEGLRTDIAHEFGQRQSRHSARRFALAERFCALHTALACLGLWLHNRDHLGRFFAEGVWLAVVLERRGEAVHAVGRTRPEWTAVLCQRLEAQFDRGDMFSVLRWPVAAAGQAEQMRDLFQEEGMNEGIAS